MISGAAVIDLQDAQRLLKRYDSVNMVFLQLNPGNDPQRVAETINHGFENLFAASGGEFMGKLRMIKKD
jgi:hypothetical protein